jgi:hypothetical protein
MAMGTRRSAQEGLTAVGLLVYLAIAAAIYLGWLYAPVGWKYYQVREVLGRIANMAYTEKKDDFLQRMCAQHMLTDAELKIHPDQCKIDRNNVTGTVTVSYTYKAEVRYAPTDYVRRHVFPLDVTRSLSDR